MERFERKYLELPFKELAQLKQVGTPEAYMLEFEKLSVMVSHVSMASLVLFFYWRIGKTFERTSEIPQSIHIEGCREFDKGFVECIAKNQIPSQANFPSKFKEGKKTWKKDSYTK